MRELTDILRALGDESRLRAVLALSAGELCLCQLIELLGLAPSTVSKHMAVLWRAGLVDRRKDGRWHYYRLAEGDDTPAAAREALAFVVRAAEGERVVVRDAEALCCIKRKDLAEVAACYGSAGSGTHR